MFWLGDSKCYRWQSFKNLPLEFWAGVRDNIPLCCVIIYILCILASLLTKKDGVIFEFVYRIEKDFKETGYWRCPLCKWRRKVNKIRWDTKGYS